MNTATQLALMILAIPVTALAIGWLFGRNSEQPEVDPDELVSQQSLTEDE